MPILEVKNLSKRFAEHDVTALDNVSFQVNEGETLGILGESGSGKSTLAKILMGFLNPDRGDIYFSGKNKQIIFQDPLLSLDPKMRVEAILKEPFQIKKISDKHFLGKKIRELLSLVELPEAFLTRYPAELSGGECQRVAIARALSQDPDLLICDEPVSALDLLTQAQILNLFLKLQKNRRLSLIFISHDLKVIHHMSDQVLILKSGRVCERDDPYAQELLANKLSPSYNN